MAPGGKCHIAARLRRPGKTNTEWRLVSRDLGTQAKDREMLRDARHGSFAYRCYSGTNA
jgi:hypothetical protein